jgi:hypothetical protein
MKRVALIGDSHAKVVFRYMIPMLEGIGLKKVYSRAENGWSLKKHIQKGTLKEIRNARPEVILVSLGGNNQDTDSYGYKKVVDELLETANSIKATVVWVGPTTSNPNVARNTEKRHAWTHNFLSKYLPKRKVAYIDNRKFTAQGWKSDGVHYPMGFYKKWASRVAQYLPKAIQNKSKGKTLVWVGIGSAIVIGLGLMGFGLVAGKGE